MGYFNNLINGLRVRCAINRAERRHKRTRYRYLVINWGWRLKVVRRTDLKKMIKSKFFKKHITIESFEKAAVYKTY